MDCAELGGKYAEITEKALVVRDCRTKMLFTHGYVDNKASEKYLATRILEDLDVLGYSGIVLKTDGERTIRKIARLVKENRSQQTMLMRSAAYSSQNNGAAERAVGSHGDGQSTAPWADGQAPVRHSADPCHNPHGLLSWPAG